MAEQVLAVEHGNAEDLLAAFGKHGEIRRLALLFVDLVDSSGYRSPSQARYHCNRRIQSLALRGPNDAPRLLVCD